MRRIVRLGALPLGILILGFVLFRMLLSMSEPPARVNRSYSGPLVEALELPAVSVRVTVEAHGTVRPSAQIDLVPQVSGVAVWKSEALEAGGFFSTGDLLLQIDPEEYELALQRSEAEVAQSQYHLAIAKEESEVARSEWDRLSTHDDAALESANPLVFRLPQLHAAEADLKAAMARLAMPRRLRSGTARPRRPARPTRRCAAAAAGTYPPPLRKQH